MFTSARTRSGITSGMRWSAESPSPAVSTSIPSSAKVRLMTFWMVRESSAKKSLRPATCDDSFDCLRGCPLANRREKAITSRDSGSRDRSPGAGLRFGSDKRLNGATKLAVGERLMKESVRPGGERSRTGANALFARHQYDRDAAETLLRLHELYQLGAFDVG